jgi:subtilisin family serine protease
MNLKTFTLSALIAVSGSVLAQEPEFVPGELLVQFKSGASDPDLNEALAKVNGKAEEHIQTPLMKKMGKEGLFRIKVNKELHEAAKILKHDERIEFVEPNYILRGGLASNDPFYTGTHLWGLYGDTTYPKNVYGSQVAETWAAGSIGHKKIHVGIIDEGVQIRHPDLVNNIWRNQADPIDGVDNDGNGYVDDYNGWGFYNNDNSVYDSTADSHGTHVAGTIGARGGNGVGVAGMNWYVTMIPVKFLGVDGGTTDDAIKAMDYLTDLKLRKGIDLVATNNSWGGGGYSQALKDAIGRAGAQNILVVAAAGNGGSDGLGDSTDLYPQLPGAYDNANIISVAAIDRYGALASFSNFGAASVDIGAPGVSIYSTVPSSAYASYSGTSMATPHVTGALALMAARNSARGVALKNLLLSKAIPTPSLAGKTLTGARLNAGL